MYWRAASILQAQDLANIPARIFEADDRSKTHLLFCERLANNINQEFFADPLNKELRDSVDTNLDHGYNHFRRVEKWYKEIIKNSPELRGNVPFLYFAPDGFLAVRFHDLVQLHTGQKTGHDAAAALLSLGFLLSPEHLENPPIPRSDWEKIAWGSAFVIRHHSDPEVTKELPSADFRNGKYLDPQTLLAETEAMAEKAGKNLYDFFPPFESVAPVIEAIRQGEIKRPPPLTDSEAKGLLSQTLIFAAADKMDSLHPAELSSTRTILTMPNRRLYVQYEEPFAEGSELAHRAAKGGSHGARTDFDRYLYEITRHEPFVGQSAWLSNVYNKVMLTKATFLRQAFPALLSGDFGPILDVYDRLERDTVMHLLRRANVAGDTIHHIDSAYKVRQNFLTVARVTLREQGYDDRLIDSYLERIGQEKDLVQRAIEAKYEAFKEVYQGQLPLIHTQVEGLLDEAAQQIRTHARPSSTPIEDPVGLYYAPPKMDIWRLPSSGLKL